MSTRFGVQFKLVRCYYAQRRAGRPRSSPFPLRGNFFSCCEAANLCGITRALPYAMIFCPFRALIHCIDTVLDKRHDVKAPQKTK
ncbi:MAG: hypothetical protein LBQ66_15155 [Planctomycetaceae bacterium]|nr:hypothetical protein [Planctomycetaceae bacterium]